MTVTETTHTVRKDRVDRSGLHDMVKRGPTHRVYADNQTWCGAKIRGFSSWNSKGNAEDVDCVKCQRAIAQNQPRAWKR